jgi:BolA family transcriptional regulator, general stress-responsive regulator
MDTQETGPIATEMLRRLNSALSPSRIELIDESEQHRGHGGYNPAGESHFTLRIESPAFADKSRVQRQRMIYAALGDLMDSRVHALSISASAPAERCRGGAAAAPPS